VLEWFNESDLSSKTAQFLKAELDEHRTAFESTREALELPFSRTLDIFEQGILDGGKLLFFGNGGSAADAQHLAAELMVRYKADRPAISAIALTTDTSAMTACANDLGFDTLFERQIEGLGRVNDVAVAISTSGRSENVLRALRRAKSMGLATVGLTGGTAGEMTRLCDALIVIPSPITARVQEMHIMVGHMLCKALETRLGRV
jgi:D-sedoheptulose 7-phosphate isomerase